MTAVAAVVLAAGAGRRLGGHPKALLPFGGELLVERAVRVAREGGCDPVVVVLGAEAIAVREQAKLDGCIVATNRDWATGMGSSLQVGLAAVPAATAALVLLVDQPFVDAGAVRAVIVAHNGGACIAVATYDGKRGHPVLFAADLLPQVAASARGDMGARRFLATHKSSITPVPCGDAASAADIDTPDDLRKLACWRRVPL